MACAADVVGAAMARGPLGEIIMQAVDRIRYRIIIVFRPGVPRSNGIATDCDPHAWSKFKYTACTMQPS